MEHARKVLLVTSAAAAAFFMFLLFMLSTDPGQFEERLKNFAVKTVTSETVQFADNRGITLPDNIAGSEMQQRLAEKLNDRGEKFQMALEMKVDDVIANVLANACSLDCDKRESVRDLVGGYLTSKAEEYDVGAAAMRDFAVGRYDARVKGLHRDLVIVATTNLVIFIAIFGLAAGKTRFMPILVKIGLVALVSATILLVWYIFGQDWMTTLVFNQFVGLGYTVFLGLIFLSLCDLIANKARVLSAIANIFGTSLTIVSC